MALNSANDAIVARRRRRVASLLLNKLTQREIVDALASEGFINPETGEPYSLATVNGDVKTLKREWQKEARQDIEQHTARILAELQEVKRSAWAKGQLFNVLRALDAERDLLGLTAAVRVKMEITDWRSQAIADIRTGKLEYTSLASAFDDSLATELFNAAGVPIGARDDAT